MLPDSSSVTAPKVSVEVIWLPDKAALWHLVTKYMELRREVFIERKDWSLWHAENMEFEQYDTLDTVFVVAHENGHVVGGGRLRRTDQRVGGMGGVNYSYMIRDAVLGLLPGLPTELLFSDPPIDPEVWELTRFVATKGMVAGLMLRTINNYLYEQGGRSCLCLGSKAFLRMARMVGWDVQPAGPLCGNKDGRFLVFDCPVVNPDTLPTTGINLRSTRP